MAAMPLGLAYIAGAVRKARPGDDLVIVDGRNLGLKARDIVDRIRDFRADVVGLTATIMDASETHALAGAIKAAFPRIKLVLGGPYATSCWETVVRDANIDALVLGEGEETFIELLEAFENGQQDLSQVRGLAYLEAGVPRMTAPRPPIDDLDSLEVAWDLLGPSQYFHRLRRNSHNRIRKHHQVMGIFTSRGCPYDCIYCHNMFGKKLRTMSPERIVSEVALLRDRWGAREIEFIDDNFNQQNDHAKAVFHGLLEKDLKLDFSFPNGLRGDRLDAELLDLFAQAGVFRISLAVESASPRIQRSIRKKLNLERVTEAIRMSAQRRIVTVGFFILGFPTETREEMQMTIDYACRSAIHVADFFYLNPYPGTAIAAEYVQKLDGLRYDDFSAMPTNLSAVHDVELRRMMRRAYRQFYVSPRRLWRILEVVPKNHMLVRNALITARLCFEDGASK